MQEHLTLKDSKIAFTANNLAPFQLTAVNTTKQLLSNYRHLNKTLEFCIEI